MQATQSALISFKMMRFTSSFFKRKFGVHTNTLQEEIPVRSLCNFSPRFEIENHAILQDVPTLSATSSYDKLRQKVNGSNKIRGSLSEKLQKTAVYMFRVKQTANSFKLDKTTLKNTKELLLTPPGR